jgi:hypothetical protein
MVKPLVEREFDSCAGGAFHEARSSGGEGVLGLGRESSGDEGALEVGSTWAALPEALAWGL